METPALSRSGRVLKKSIRLLEMVETEIKPPRQKNITKNTSDTNTALAKTLSVKINLPHNESQSQSKILLQTMETSSEGCNYHKIESGQQTTNKSVAQARTHGVGSIVIKMKNDQKEISETPENVKRIKLSQDESGTINFRNNPQFNDSNQQQSFNTLLSPILKIDKSMKEKDQKIFVASTPKTNTSLSSKLVLPRSIQEQRRINQANRAKLQQNYSPTISQQNITNYQHNYQNDDENIKRAKKPSVSAYVLWCKENRSHIQSNYPELDFANLSKKMGGIWHTLPTNEKATWFRKAQMISTGSSPFKSIYDYDDKDLKPDIVLSSLTLPITINLNKTYDENFTNNDIVIQFEGESHQIGTDLIDLQAYLSILGDSLMTISSYIQRGIKYNSEIKYSPMAAVSTLLDTALVSMGSMASLTLSLPNVKINKDQIKKTIENVTYFMPPSELTD